MLLQMIHVSQILEALQLAQDLEGHLLVTCGS